MTRRMGRFKISADFLIMALAMPKETSLYGIRKDDYFPDTFEFVVEHPDLPELKEGEMPIVLYPKITVNHDKKPEVWATFDFGDIN